MRSKREEHTIQKISAHIGRARHHLDMADGLAAGMHDHHAPGYLKLWLQLEFLRHEIEGYEDAQRRTSSRDYGVPGPNDGLADIAGL